VGELVSEADDLWCLIELGKQVTITPKKLAECFADDRDSRSTDERISRLLQSSSRLMP